MAGFATGLASLVGMVIFGLISYAMWGSDKKSKDLAVSSGEMHKRGAGTIAVRILCGLLFLLCLYAFISNLM